MTAPVTSAAGTAADGGEDESVSRLFGRFLTERAAADEDLYYITADSMSDTDPFPRRYPDRFVNVGMAEQNAVSIGSGLAQSGKNVYLSNISTFLLYRPFDQIRLDAAHANTRLRLIGTSAGYSRAMYGNAHISVEDVAILRALPNMTVMAPGDRTELLDLLAEMDRLPGPAYLRLPIESKVLPVLHPQGTRIRLGRAAVLREGELGTLIASGHVLEQAVAWVDEWRRQGFAVRLVSMPSIKPLDTAKVAELVAEGRPVATFEEHSVIGGLGSAVAESIAETGGGVPFRRIGLPDRYPGRPGSAEYLKEFLGVPGSDQVLAWFCSARRQRRPAGAQGGELLRRGTAGPHRGAVDTERPTSGPGPHRRSTPMTDAQRVNAFLEDGYVHVPGLFSPAEVAPALAALEELRATVLADPGSHAVRYSSRPPDPVDVWGVSNIMNPALYDERLAATLAHPGLLRFVRQILGPRLRFWTAHALWSPDRVDYDLNWHKDNEEHEYYEASGRPTHVQFNVCLTADDAFRVVPGSHRRPLTQDERDEIGRLGSGELPGEVRAPCEPGDVLFFNHHTVHRGSCENGGPRRTLHMNLQAADEPVGGQTSWTYMREPGYLKTVHPALREMMLRTIEWDDAHPISRAEAKRRLRSKRDILARDAMSAR